MSSTLRTQFVNYLTLQRYSSKTKEAYIGAVYRLARHYMQSPDQLSNEQIHDYLRYCIEKRRLAWSTCNVIFSGLDCFYKNILKWDETRFSIPPRPRIKRIPMILSMEEVERLLRSIKNLKHKVLLMTAYGAGLRVSELVCLQPGHIESDPSRMVIRVEQGKGRKDRYTILSETLLDVLRKYWKTYQPGDWIFFGRDRDRPISIATAQRIYYNAKKKTGITKGRGIHTLRHCFASHLLWQGTDIHKIKRLLGHTSIKTTVKYLHVTEEQLAKIKSPLDM
jgi:site-specific recombinase XerD